MLLKGAQTRLALLLSVALHVVVFAIVANHLHWFADKPDAPKAADKIVLMQLVPPQAEMPLSVPAKPPTVVRPPELLKPTPAAVSAIAAPQDKPVSSPDSAHQPATMAAPSAPTAEEWAFAAKYAKKNSKGYRYHWGQQVRSMMGTAVEGPDQGLVRFRLEIAPDGTLAKLETLWSTSAVAEKLARKAIANMPPLPPTPTGKPLIFDKTIAFTPYAVDAPPVYKNDCLPDAPVFRNPFAWDGKSAKVQAKAQAAEALDPEALAECLKQLPQDTIEADVANNKAKMDRWGWRDSTLAR